MSAPVSVAANAPALSLAGVTHRYGTVTAVSDLSLSVAPGEVVCLLGPSGCGKSTVLRLAAGLEETQTGTVAIAGATVGGTAIHLPPELRNIGLVFQDFALFPHLCVADNIAFGLRDLDPAAQRARVAETLADVGLGHAAGAFPHMLSGGEQQRVALARALARRPRLLLLDEPFSGLDARLREQVRDVTLEALRKSGTATLMVTHDAEEAMFMADRIAVMRAGRIVQEGTPIDLYARPRSAFVAAFFGEVNRLPARIEGGQAASVFGAAPSSLPDGSAVEIVLRPEALHVALDGLRLPGSVPARVVTAHPLGQSTRLLVELEDGMRLRIRIWGLHHPDPGQPVSVAVDLRQAFVFPAD